MKHLFAALALGALTLTACNEKPLEDRTQVIGPRVLAIVADPPEVRPGETVRLHALFAGFPMPMPQAKWLICARPEATPLFTASSTFGMGGSDEGCFGDAADSVLEFGVGNSAEFTFPGDALSRLEALRAIYGDLLSEETLRVISNVAGIVATIAIEIPDPSDPARPIRAIKRVVLVNRAVTNHNPPSPRFRFGVTREGGPTSGVLMQASAQSPEVCESSPGVVLQVATGSVTEIAPEPSEDTWIEDYVILDSTGNLAPQRESGFYSWYSTAGSFSDAKTRIPTRNNLWRAPNEPQRVSHWLIVRDGRGGTSFCKFNIDVVAR